jgi:hypothetical protein
VVGVVVGEKDLAKRETHAVTHHLALIALAAVEQDGFTFALHSETGHVAIDGGNGGGGSQEGDA